MVENSLNFFLEFFSADCNSLMSVTTANPAHIADKNVRSDVSRILLRVKLSNTNEPGQEVLRLDANLFVHYALRHVRYLFHEIIAHAIKVEFPC